MRPHSRISSRSTVSWVPPPYAAGMRPHGHILFRTHGYLHPTLRGCIPVVVSRIGSQSSVPLGTYTQHTRLVSHSSHTRCVVVTPLSLFFFLHSHRFGNLHLNSLPAPPPYFVAPHEDYNETGSHPTESSRSSPSRSRTHPSRQLYIRLEHCHLPPFTCTTFRMHHLLHAPPFAPL